MSRLHPRGRGRTTPGLRRALDVSGRHAADSPASAARAHWYRKEAPLVQEVWHLLLDQIRRDLITINEQAGRGEYQAAKRGAETVAADLMRLARLYAAHHRNPPTTPTTTTPRKKKP